MHARLTLRCGGVTAWQAAGRDLETAAPSPTISAALDMADQKPVWWKRLWSVAGHWLQARDISAIVLGLLGIGGASTGVAITVPRAALSATAVERTAWTIAGGCGGGLLAIVLGYAGLWSAPRFVTRWRRTFGERPRLTVRPCGGKVAVLEIENSGGTCSLTAWGRILSVDGGSFKKRDSYPMLWRMDWQRAYVAAPHGAVLRRIGPPLKMSIAEHDIVAAGAITESILAIDGGPGRVDAIHYNPKYGSPVVTIEIRIESEPPLEPPFRRTYTAHVPADYKHAIELGEVEPSGARGGVGARESQL